MKVYALLREYRAQGITSVRIDALPKLCEESASYIDADLARLVRRGEVLRFDGRVSLPDALVSREDDVGGETACCRDCNQFLPLSAFNRSGTGLNKTCRDCSRAKKQKPAGPPKKLVKCVICERVFLREATDKTIKFCAPCSYAYAGVKAEMEKRRAKNV